MTEYQIVTSKDANQTELRVNQLLRQGFRTHGYLLVNPCGCPDGGQIYSQAMIRSDRPERPTQVVQKEVRDKNFNIGR